MLSPTAIKKLDAEDIPPDIRRYADAIGINEFLRLCSAFPGHVIRLPANLHIKIAKRYIVRHLTHDEEDLAAAVGVSLGFVRAVKEGLIQGSSLTNLVSVQDAKIIATACRMVMAFYRVTEAELLSQSREEYIVWPRHVAMYLARKFCPHIGFRLIAEIFQRTDHTTAMSAIQKVENRMFTDERKRHDVHQLIANLLAIRNADGGTTTHNPTSTNHADTAHQSQPHPTTSPERRTVRPA